MLFMWVYLLCAAMLKAVVGALALAALAAASTCPCSNPAFCKPLANPPTRKELFVFTVAPGAWKAYNFTYLTTVVPFYPLESDPTLVCTAHERGVRVVLQATDFPLANLSSAADRAAWTKLQVRVDCCLGAFQVACCRKGFFRRCASLLPAGGSCDKRRSRWAEH